MTALPNLTLVPRPPAPWVDPKTGAPTPQFYRAIVALFGLAPLVVPTGSVLDFLGPAAPPGFLALDGATYNSADYPDLVVALGVPPGTPTFTLPNTVNTFAMGSDTPGISGGSSTVTLTAQNLPIVAASNTTTGTDAGGVAAQQPVAFSIIPPYVTFMRIVKT